MKTAAAIIYAAAIACVVLPAHAGKDAGRVRKRATEALIHCAAASHDRPARQFRPCDAPKSADGVRLASDVTRRERE
ncbi:MAG TPA: hypothetical protein VFV71_03085 [Burkholderiales bacterium]|nr:hypothetical protein [Burkholderiales bacterium]